MNRLLKNQSSKLWLLASGSLLLGALALPLNAHAGPDWTKIKSTTETTATTTAPSDPAQSTPEAKDLLTNQLAQCQSSACKEQVNAAIEAAKAVDTAIAEEADAPNDGQAQMIDDKISQAFADMPEAEVNVPVTETVSLADVDKKSEVKTQGRKTIKAAPSKAEKRAEAAHRQPKPRTKIVASKRQTTCNPTPGSKSGNRCKSKKPTYSLKNKNSSDLLRLFNTNKNKRKLNRKIDSTSILGGNDNSHCSSSGGQSSSSGYSY